MRNLGPPIQHFSTIHQEDQLDGVMRLNILLFPSNSINIYFLNVSFY